MSKVTSVDTTMMTNPKSVHLGTPFTDIDAAIEEAQFRRREDNRHQVVYQRDGVMCVTKRNRVKPMNIHPMYSTEGTPR